MLSVVVLTCPAAAAAAEIDPNLAVVRPPACTTYLSLRHSMIYTGEGVFATLA